jgi:hypothetical protein
VPEQTLAQRHEEEFAADLDHVGVRQTIASGSVEGNLDANTGVNGDSWRFWYSLKCTVGRGIRLTREIVEEARQAAYSRSSDCRPSWGMRIYEDDHSRKPGVFFDGVLVELSDWVELLEELQDLRRRLGQQRPTVQA